MPSDDLVTSPRDAFILRMPPCHTTPFVQPGIIIEPGPAAPQSTETCDYCGSARVGWRKCKLICDDCKQINKSCADL